MTRTARSRLVGLLLAVLLAVSLAPPAHAAGGPADRSQEPGVLTALWQFLVKLLPATGKGRAGLDPNGQPSVEAEPQSGDSVIVDGGETEGRAGMDPDG